MALSLAMVSGGCSYRMDSLFARKSDADIEASGSTRMPRQRLVAAGSQDGVGSGDLASAGLSAARGAVSEALGKSGREASVPWEDPSTGARGTVTPLSNAYTQDGVTCRDFLASVVRNGSEAWLQGEACRATEGRWDVRHMRPWRRT